MDQSRSVIVNEVKETFDRLSVRLERCGYIVSGLVVCRNRELSFVPRTTENEQVLRRYNTEDLEPISASLALVGISATHLLKLLHPAPGQGLFILRQLRLR